MIDLVLIYCLNTAPDRCLERRQPLEAAANLIQCTLGAQTMAQDYLRSHPAYSLRGWRCEMDKPRESPA
ncbi:MAG: hypothetical protein JOZ05_23925 [Acetobacteraceae bacterium]|nr:hypothetical protein [Acetobacteraceae bacterium]